MLMIIMNFSLSIVYLITNNTNAHKPTFLKHYHWIYGKGYVTRTQISIGGEQDRDTLIEQSLNHSNRAVTLLLQ